MIVSPADGGSRPPMVLLCGVLGLIPFLAPPIAGWAFPAVAELARSVLIAYGAVILSFLGGARWGLALRQSPAPVMTLSLAMLPAIVALALIAMPGMAAGWRLAGLAVALAMHAIWDVSAADMPGWYPSLRIPLTLCAILGLCLGILL